MITTLATLVMGIVALIVSATVLILVSDMALEHANDRRLRVLRMMVYGKYIENCTARYVPAALPRLFWRKLRWPQP